MPDQDWLAKLKAGDKVLIRAGGWGDPSYTEATVEAAGKIHVTIGGSKYRRRDGRRVSDTSWCPSRLELYDKKIMDKQEREEERSSLGFRLESIRWRDKPLKLLRAIAALLPGKDGAE